MTRSTSKNICTIEVRMGSSRLPGKVLKPFAGAPLLQRLIERTKRAKCIDKIVIATTQLPRDDILERVAKDLGVDIFRGSEDDVTGRLAGTIRSFSPEHVVSLTGDNPFIDPALIDAIHRFFIDGYFDYVSNTYMENSPLWDAERTFPKGVSVQIYKATALLEIDAELAQSDPNREHATLKIYDRADEKYSLGAFEAVGEFKDWRAPNLRMTVDTLEDYNRAVEVFDPLFNRNPEFSTLKAINRW